MKADRGTVSMQAAVTPFNDLTTLGIYCPLQPFARLPRVFEEISENGFTHLCFSDVFCIPLTKRHIRHIKRALGNAGLKVHSAHFAQVLPPPWKTMKWMLERHARALDLAAEFGVRFVTTHFGWMLGLDNPRLLRRSILKLYLANIQHNAHVVYEELYKKTGGAGRFMDMNREAYRYLALAGEARGITPTIETACCNLTRTPAQIIKLIERIGSANLGICLDAGHSHVMGVAPARAIKQAGKYLLETHFHDNFGARDRHYPVGIGTIDWIAVIRALRGIGYSDAISFEPTAQLNGDYLGEMRMYAANWKCFLRGAADLDKLEGS